MPFEQRSIIYFICKDCKHEYAILGNPEYSKIYECSENGCNYKEPFLGTTPLTNYNISAQETFWSRLWHNSIFQGIVTGLITFIILGVITVLITLPLLGDFKADVVKKVKSEIVQKKE